MGAAKLASGGAQGLRDDLDRQGKLRRCYWICAFCVNQHANICGGFAPRPRRDNAPALTEWEDKRRDRVTGDVFESCGCRQQKFFSGAPDECELNKFDDM